MSLYFNWSCDFQRFTKSKKLSKFQVRTTTLFISNKSLSTSLFNLQGTICCFQRVFTTFRCSEPLINSLFSITKPEAFVKNFFQILFLKNQAVLNQTFRFCACLSETALIEYQIREQMSRVFSSLSDIYFSFLLTRLITKAAIDSPALTADSAHAIISHLNHIMMQT